MPVASGTRIGPYEILMPIGAGGMGEVYRARDLTLKRDVALKLLPLSFVNDLGRMARFQREAEVLAPQSPLHRSYFWRRRIRFHSGHGVKYAMNLAILGPVRENLGPPDCRSAVGV